MKITIYRNLATGKIEFRAIKYIGEKSYYMTDGEWIEFDGFVEIPPILSVPLNTEIETDLKENQYKSLLEQKDKDKNKHIDDLKSLLEMTIKLRV